MAHSIVMKKCNWWGGVAKKCLQGLVNSQTTHHCNAHLPFWMATLALITCTFFFKKILPKQVDDGENTEMTLSGISSPDVSSGSAIQKGFFLADRAQTKLHLGTPINGIKMLQNIFGTSSVGLGQGKPRFKFLFIYLWNLLTNTIYQMERWNIECGKLKEGNAFCRSDMFPSADLTFQWWYWWPLQPAKIFVDTPAVWHWTFSISGRNKAKSSPHLCTDLQK